MSSFLIAYGSHTGQAEQIAKGIKEQSELIGLNPKIFELDQNEKQFDLNGESFAVIVVSSTGDGDAPDNAARFVRRISRKSLPNDYMSRLEYAILGLGDSNYSSYQAIPKKIDDQLSSLGASRVLERGEADDQVGLELCVEPWIEKLFAYLAERFDVQEDKMNALTETRLKLNPVKSDEEKNRLLKEMKENIADSDQEPVERFQILQPEPYEYSKPSIIKGADTLSADLNLRVPIAPQSFILSSVSHKKFDQKLACLEWQNECKMVGVESAPILAYEPGDAMYFCVTNPENEVNFILKRCGVLEIADQECELSILPKTEKFNPQIPGHIHKKSSLRHIFTTCLDIRRAPGRPILRILAECASDANEKRRLFELCSAQGMNDFTAFVRQPGLSLADVLFAFPSIKPPVDRLIELLPRLSPRPYSMSSYNQKRARFVYSELEFTAEEGRRYRRKGLCTDWLNALRVGDVVRVLGKEPARFRLPPPPNSRSDAGKMPLLMIGPGTGVSVFLSFCHFLLKMKLEAPEDFTQEKRILFFGCRDLNIDGIYIEELRGFVREGILSDLIVCESQKNGERVQDGLKKNLEKVLPFLEPSPLSKIFICGDAKGMSKDVWQCFADIVAQNDGITDKEAKAKLLDLKKNDQYIEDVWG
ncbi:unnamed protein product [Caenorhabditis bovis]|uniref:Methionine synthase reductase n=1 Tax=Caenorhabditis bovis TaxID=2654633 RepID=A0A8S1EUU7_9PELO|nr:unnamed protein product [Caenorhabditis bovis]